MWVGLVGQLSMDSESVENGRAGICNKFHKKSQRLGHESTHTTDSGWPASQIVVLVASDTDMLNHPFLKNRDIKFVSFERRGDAIAEYPDVRKLPSNAAASSDSNAHEKVSAAGAASSASTSLGTDGVASNSAVSSRYVVCLIYLKYDILIFHFSVSLENPNFKRLIIHNSAF